MGRLFKSSMVLGLLAAPVAVAISGVPGAAAASQGTVTEMTNTETIQARLDATGKVTEARVYEQIAVNGDGKIEIVNPVSTNGLRNLDGFGGFKIEGDSMVASIDVQGRKRLRTVSDYKKDLPLGVEVKYELNGNEVDPKKVVGASGDLVVTYTVTNLTASKQSVSFDDGTGKQLTEDMDVVIPMVGSLTTVLPAKFTEVQSDQANMAGDGRGGTKLSFTMTLFPPIGSDTAQFGYTAKIRDGEVPAASISALPVQPLQSPSFKAGAESYAGGADTGAQLTAGAVEIDTNLLKLRDGASELLAGLIQLRDGASQLRDGLQGEAAPGAHQLASGAGRLDQGANDLAAGSRELDAGAGKLAAGAGTASAGAATLAAGVERLSGGIDQLADVKGLPAVAAGLQQLRYAIDHPVGAQGKSDPGGLLQGLRQVQAGLSNPKCDPEKPSDPKNPCGVSEGLAALAGGLPEATAALDGLITPKLKDIKKNVDDRMLPGIQRMRDGYDDALKTGGSIDQLAGAVSFAKASAGCQTDPLCQGTLTEVQKAVETLRGKTQEADTGAEELEGGLKQISAGSGQLAGGTEQVSAGIKDAIAGVAALRAGVDGLLVPGVNAIEDGVETRLLGGVDQLLAGMNKAVAGIFQLSDGGKQAADGANQLADGLPTLSSGAKQLSDGTGKLKAGAGQLADGTGQLKDGAGKLADGLGDAADGSGQLADGLVQAADGAPQIVDGAQRLSDEGMGPLTDAGMSTAQEFGSKYALIEAVNERAANEGMAFGAPEGANGLTAYSLEISGEDGEGGRNMARGLGALAVLGLGTGLVAGVRNRLF